MGFSERDARRRRFCLAVAFVFIALAPAGPPAAASLTVWDTATPLPAAPDLGSRSQWKAVPTDLMTLESDPPKASSDPGYYGREYEFSADTVVTNDHFDAVLGPKGQAIAIYTGSTRRAAIRPRGQDAPIHRVRLIRNSPDAVVVEVVFAPDDPAVSMLLHFDNTPIITLKPGPKMASLDIETDVAYAVAPDFIADDLILSPSGHNSEKPMTVPAKNVLVGLLHGRDAMLVLTWPAAQQQAALRVGTAAPDAAFDRIYFDHNGKSLSLAILEAPGIWHQEIFGPGHLEKPVRSDWRRPFGAKWITQLDEAGVQTRYTFRASGGTVWRGAFGSYTYPVWFDGDTAVYHMTKKIPPKGKSIVYFLEGAAQPSIMNPADVIQCTLGRELADTILDPAGRMLRTHHRRGAAGVRRACTCGGTEAIEAVFKAGQEAEHADDVQGIVDDMAFFVTCHIGRIEQYMQMVRDTIAYLDRCGADKAFVNELKTILAQIPREQEQRKELVKSLDYMADLVRRTKALTLKKDANNLQSCLQLGEQWRSMGGAQDDLLAQCHRLTRLAFQQAGRSCATRPEFLPIAREIRARCRECLRNPDGYEIWADY